MSRLIVGLSAKRVTTALGFIIAILAGLHFAAMVFHFRIMEIPWLLLDLFDLDEEQSFGTWVSAAMLLFAGQVLLVYARDARPRHWSWRALGFGFCILSLDEVVGLHESLNMITDFSWTLPGAVVAGFAALLSLPFLAVLPARTRWLFVLAGAVYLGGALGVERATDWYQDAKLLDTLEYNLTTVLEEAMEMTGVAIFIYALLSHIAASQGESNNADEVLAELSDQ